MTITKLCSELAKREKTKSQAKKELIKRIVGHLSDILWDEYQNTSSYYSSVMYKILVNGKRRARKKGKK